MEAALAECFAELPAKASSRVRRLLRLRLCVSLVSFEPSCVIEHKPPFCPNPRLPRHGRLWRRLHAQGCVGTSGPHQSAKPCHSPTAQTGNNIHRHFAFVRAPRFIRAPLLQGQCCVRTLVELFCFGLVWFAWGAKNFVCARGFANSLTLGRGFGPARVWFLHQAWFLGTVAVC